MLTHFSYSSELTERFPDLHSLTVHVRGVNAAADVTSTVDEHLAKARALLQEHQTESNLPSVQAWRAAYRATGTDPTKFRMAAESILRRLRSTGEFSRNLHPLVLVCNALSARFAVPVAALDCDRIEGALQVRNTSEAVRYEAFDGATATLAAGEVTFVDAAGNAHARKWSHKQSARSAVSAATQSAFVVCEALHRSGKAELSELEALLTDAISLHWPMSEVSSQHLFANGLARGADVSFQPR